MASIPFRSFLCLVVFLLLSGAVHPDPSFAASSRKKQPSTVQYKLSTVDGHSELLIRSDKPIDQYESALVESPPRLVLDIDNVTFPKGVSKINVNRDELKRIRIGEHEGKVRFVFDLSLKYPVEHHVEQVSEGLKVIVKLAEESKENSGGTEEKPVADASSAPDPYESALQSVSLSDKVYTGERISIQLNQASLRDFFSLISEACGTPIEVAPDVDAQVSMHLDDTPWDKAMDMVIRYHGLKLEKQSGIFKVSAGVQPTAPKEP